MHLAFCCRSTRFGPVALGWLAVLSAVFISRAEAQPSLKTIALSGVETKYGPQLGAGVTFDSFLGLDVNSSNHFVFNGTLSAPDSFPAVGGIWSSDQTTTTPLALVRRTGVNDPALFRRVEEGKLDESGSIAFRGNRGSISSNSPGVWLHEQDQNTPIMEQGHLGLIGFGPQQFANGRVVFSATTDDENERGLWTSSKSGTVPIAQQNTDGPLGPNLGPGARFITLPVFDYGINSSGEAIFYSTVARVSAPGTHGIWRTTPSGPQALAIEGVSGPLGPNLANGAVFTEISPSLGVESGVDDVAFWATFLRENVTETGVFKVGANGNNLIALSRTDGPLGPQLSPGVTFVLNLSGVRSINSRGDVLFSSALSGAGKPQTGVWINSDNGNVPVALTLTDAQHGPRLGPGTEFAGILLPYVDDSGQVVFQGHLRGASINSANDAGIWVWSSGDLLPLVREGEFLSIDTGAGIEQRRVQSFLLGQPNADPQVFDRPSSSQGLIPLQIEFDDGSSGIFVAQIPEPPAIALFAVGLLAILVGRSWRWR